MSEPTPNPLHYTHRALPPVAVSKQTIPIAGILTTVYGLSELPADATEIACLWLLHPRLQTQACMQPIAASTIGEYNRRAREQRAGKGARRGLIAVSFDQRNHGSREVDKLANEAWRAGNPRHAQDMFSIYHGTALDTSLLLTHLPSYLPSAPPLAQHLVLGISLGGHAAYLALLHDPRIAAAVAVIGCPDYARLMAQRAARSKLASWTAGAGAGAGAGTRFFGGPDFPAALVDAVRRHDPAGLLAAGVDLDAGAAGAAPPARPSRAEQARLEPLLRGHLGGKALLALSGGADKLVPRACSAPFLRWLAAAVGPGGWAAEVGLEVRDLVFEGVGHEMSPEMAREAVAFVCGVVAGGGDGEGLRVGDGETGVAKGRM